MNSQNPKLFPILSYDPDVDSPNALIDAIFPSYALSPN